MISTAKNDRQGEVVLQNGLNFTEFLQNGWFNDNHSKETTGIVGYPIKVERRKHAGKDGHYVEGYLLPNYEPADKIWKLANSLQKTGRRLGFSIEGAVTRRAGNDGRTIAEAKVRNVAITNCPVNTDTGLEVLAKSMMALEADGDEYMRRAMMAGQAINDPGSAPGQGFALRTESMERKPKRKKRLSKADAIDLLQKRYRGMSKAHAERILAYVAARGAA